MMDLFVKSYPNMEQMANEYFDKLKKKEHKTTTCLQLKDLIINKVNNLFDSNISLNDKKRKKSKKIDAIKICCYLFDKYNIGNQREIAQYFNYQVKGSVPKHIKYCKELLQQEKNLSPDDVIIRNAIISISTDIENYLKPY